MLDGVLPDVVCVACELHHSALLALFARRGRFTDMLTLLGLLRSRGYLLDSGVRNGLSLIEQ